MQRNFYLKMDTLKVFRFSENLAGLFFLLSRHKFSSIAIVKVSNFNAEKMKKKKLKNRKAMCFECTPKKASILMMNGLKLAVKMV